MKKLISALTVALFAAALVTAAGTPVDPGTGTPPEPTQTWEQKQEALKTCEQSILQDKEQIRTLEQQKLQASTDAEKAQIQLQIDAKNAELTQLQNQYEHMIANQQAFKYQWKDANNDGVNDNTAGASDPEARAYMYKNGYGYGYGFADKNGDGVNDNFVDADQDGKCDTDPAMAKTRLQSRDQVKGKSQHGEHGKEQSRDRLRGAK